MQSFICILFVIFCNISKRPRWCRTRGSGRSRLLLKSNSSIIGFAGRRCFVRRVVRWEICTGDVQVGIGWKDFPHHHLTHKAIRLPARTIIPFPFLFHPRLDFLFYFPFYCNSFSIFLNAFASMCFFDFNFYSPLCSPFHVLLYLVYCFILL